jgi:membrane dipeptidase
MLLAPERVRSADIDPRVADIVAKTIAADRHSHVQIRFTNGFAGAGPDPDIDLADEMKRSGFSAVCQTYGVDALLARQPGDYYKHQLQALAFEDRLLKRNRMRRALNMSDFEAAHRQRQPVIIQSTEGAQFLDGRLERLEENYKRGLRHLQLLHERDDMVSPLGDVYTAAAHLGGLTPFGAEVIKECNRLGIVVDLAHGNDQTVRAALKVAAQPLIISHAGVKNDASTTTISADMQRRLIPDDQARAVADAAALSAYGGACSAAPANMSRPSGGRC